jgi:hypothetical protein
MERELNKLKEFQKWFDKFITKNYGKKCPDFVWGCVCCHANLVKEFFSDFVDDLIDTEKWHQKQSRKKKQIKTNRKKPLVPT